MDCTKDTARTEVVLCWKGIFQRPWKSARGTDKGTCWGSRYCAWQKHVQAYAQISHGATTSSAKDWKGTRIAFATSCLDTVDRKIGWLLTSQGLLTAVASILVGRFVEFYQTWMWGTWFKIILGILLLGGVSWIVSTLLCLWTFGFHLEWGDLGKRGLGDDARLNEAEEEHVNTLIHEVIRRTANFRVAVRLTLYVIFLTMVAAVLWTITLMPEATRRKGLARIRDEYVSASRAGQADRVAALFTDNARLFCPHQPPMVGKSAILMYFKNFYNQFTPTNFELSPDIPENAATAKSWAFDRGTYAMSVVSKGGGPMIDDYGEYLVILQRQSDGSWRVACAMYTSSRPAQPAPQPVKPEGKRRRERRRSEGHR